MVAGLAEVRRGEGGLCKYLSYHRFRYVTDLGNFQDALKDRQYTPGEIYMSEMLVFKSQAWDVGTWIWPNPAELHNKIYQYIGRIGVARDTRHRSPIFVDWSTVPLVRRELDNLDTRGFVI